MQVKKVDGQGALGCKSITSNTLTWRLSWRLGVCRISATESVSGSAYSLAASLTKKWVCKHFFRFLFLLHYYGINYFCLFSSNVMKTSCLIYSSRSRSWCAWRAEAGEKRNHHLWERQWREHWQQRSSGWFSLILPKSPTHWWLVFSPQLPDYYFFYQVWYACSFCVFGRNISVYTNCLY